MQHSDLVDPVTLLEEIEQVGLVVSVKALAHGLVVRLADVQQPIALGMKVGVETEVGRPRRVPVVI